MNYIKKVMIASIFILVGMWSQPMEASAELSGYATLKVAGTVMVENGVVKETLIQDGKGGTAVYDEKTNTLTLNNFHYIEGLDEKFYIFGVSMSEFEKLHIVLNGTNDFTRSDRIGENTTADNATIKLDGDVVIEGTGKLIVNTRIAFNKVEIKDCAIEIKGLYYGIYCTSKLVVDNAEIDVSMENYSLHSAAIFIHSGSVEIRDSNVKVKAKTGYFNSFLCRIVDDNLENLNACDTFMKLGDDIIVTDDAGNALNICGVKWVDRYFFGFSKDGVKGSLLEDEDSISNTVYIISKNKAAMTEKIKEVQSLINAIGNVQLTSGEKIKLARVAYDSLSQFGDKANYAKAQITNYQILLEAEKTYAILVQEEKERLAAEEEARRQAQSEQEESTKAEKESQKENTPKDKTIIVKSKKYVIKTPTLKSVKSKKKKTLTLKFTSSKKNKGYQISYAQNKKFKKAKKVTIKNKKSKTATIKKLKSKKNYYVRIRAYRKINGKNYYGNWSNVKKVRVK